MVYHGGGGLQNTYSLSERPKGGIVMVGVGADPADDKKALACVFASDPTNASRLNDFLNSEVVRRCHGLPEHPGLQLLQGVSFFLPCLPSLPRSPPPS